MKPNGIQGAETQVKDEDEIFQSEAIFGRPIREATDTRLFDWNFLDNFSDRLNALFQAEAECALGSQSNYVDINSLRARRNPEIVKVVGELDMVMDYLNFKPSPNPNRLSQLDIE